MKQKQLTDEQRDVLKRLEVIFKEAEEKNIGFVFDHADSSLSAYNKENIEYCYTVHFKEEEGDEMMNWEVTAYVDSAIDSFNSDMHYYYVKFK